MARSSSPSSVSSGAPVTHDVRRWHRAVLRRSPLQFDPVPFGAEAARIYGRLAAAVVGTGRRPRKRALDLMIAATAGAEELSLYTTNPADYEGLERLISVVAVTGPVVSHER
jgi:predicted nucleic acid-binding protein